MNRGRKLGLFLFGALLIVLFAGIAIAQGVSNPSVPSGDIALVEDVPDGAGDISMEDYDRAILQTVARSGLQEAPKEGDAQFDQIHEAAINDLLDQAWLTGEASELGITATDREVAAELETVKDQQFKTEAEFNKYLKEANFTLEEVTSRVRLQLLSQKIQDKITKSVSSVPDSDIENYYEGAKDQFTTPEARDILVIVNKDKAKIDEAKAALEENSDKKAFAAAAKKYSTDPTASAGGVRAGVTEGVIADPAGSEIFDAPDDGTIIGPIENDDGYYLFKVTKVTPEETQPLDTVRQQVSQQLVQQAQQSKMTSFVKSYNAKWTSRTFCAEDYTTSRCSNFKGDGRVEGADPACYKAGAGDPAKPLVCPASVFQLKPALPGSSTVLAPNGIQLPQHPITSGDSSAAPAAGAGAAGTLGGTDATAAAAAQAQAAAAAQAAGGQ